MLFLTSSLALGSGGSGGSYSFGQSNYDVGKRVFFEKLRCDKCPLSDLTLDRESIASILPSLRADPSFDQLLSIREKNAVEDYLRKRFNL